MGEGLDLDSLVFEEFAVDLREFFVGFAGISDFGVYLSEIVLGVLGYELL